MEALASQVDEQLHHARGQDTFPASPDRMPVMPQPAHPRLTQQRTGGAGHQLHVCKYTDPLSDPQGG